MDVDGVFLGGFHIDAQTFEVEINSIISPVASCSDAGPFRGWSWLW